MEFVVKLCKIPSYYAKDCSGKSLRAVNIEKCSVTKDRTYYVGIHNTLFQLHVSSDEKNI